MHTIHHCPSCGTNNVTPFYQVDHVPVHSVLLMPHRDVAQHYPTGSVTLTLCRECGFIYNADFNPDLTEYTECYEETQGFSPTFTAFATQQAETLIQRYDLHHKVIVEIGCGKGEFLTLLCRLGNNRGIGYDPTYVAGRSSPNQQIQFIQDVYTEAYTSSHCDFICCKMTLEHIPHVATFLSVVQRAVAHNPHAVLFFQVPDVTTILATHAFYDIYYEHCSYFSPGAFARLFRRHGFVIRALQRTYHDQYLTIEACRADDQTHHHNHTVHAIEETPATMAHLVDTFVARVGDVRAQWQQRLAAWHRANKRVVLWGAGSKGVAFLTTLNQHETVTCAVDINPFKHKHFMPGSGHAVVAPNDLVSLQPDVVIVMNPIYREEITRSIQTLGLSPEIVTV